MTKILFVGDPHLDSRTPISRADDYEQVTIDKLTRIKEICISNDIKTVVLTGDTFDKDNYDQPLGYINTVIAKFKEFHDAGIVVYSLIGNHDLRHNKMEYFTKSPLHILFQTQFVKHLVEETLDDVVLYGIDFTEKDKVHEINEKLDPTKTNILTMHYATDNTVPYESISRDAFKNFDLVVSGHDHMYYEPSQDLGGAQVLRPGSMIRRTKDPYNLERIPIAYEVQIHSTKSFDVKEHTLTNKSAEVVFKTHIFTMGGEANYSRDSIAGLFTDQYFRKELISLRQIIEALPPPVSDNTKDKLLKYITEQGL